MKIKMSDLRNVIREAIVDKMRTPNGPNSRDNGEGEDMEVEDLEEVYMSPKNVRGVGPEVDKDQEWGKLSSTAAAVRFPKAIHSLVQMYLESLMPEDIIDMFGTMHPYPKDVADMFNFKLDNGKLVATGDVGVDYAGTWNPAIEQWEDHY